MKICLMHSIYKPYYSGGAEVVFDNIALQLKKRNEDFFVISLGYENKQEEIDGIKVYRIKPFNLFNFLDINKNKPAWLRLPWHLIDMVNDVQSWRIYRILEKEKPDLIYCQGLKGLGYLLPRVFKALKIRYIYRVYDMQLIHPTGLLQPGEKIGILSRLYCSCCRRLFGSPPVVLFPSNFVKSIYESHKFFPKSKKVVMGNPIEIKTQEVSQNNSLPLNLVFLGQVVEFKGIFELIAAVKQLSAKVKLHIVGEGADLDRAKELSAADPKIIFHGRMNQQQLGEAIWTKADLLVNPSKVPETFGMVVIEAYAHGVPVVASDIGALSELVNSRTGWLVQPADARELKERLEQIINDPDALRNKRSSCLKEAEKYLAENYINKLLSL